MSIVWAITRKDLRQRLRDRSVFVFAIVVPLGLATLFSLVFSGAEEGFGGVTFALAVEDAGPVGALFGDEVMPAVEDELGLAALLRVEDRDAAEAAVEAGDADAALVVPAGFSASVQVGGGATIEVLRSADSSLAGDVAVAVAEAFATRMTGTQLAVATALQSGAAPSQTQAIIDAASSVLAPVRLVSDATRDRSLDIGSYLAAGMAVFFLFFTVQLGVLSYLEEREQGTLARIHAAPVRRWQVVVAKALTSYLIGVVATAVLIIGSAALLGAHWGDPVGVALLVLVGVAAATVIVMVVARFARTAEQANVWQSIIAIVLGMLGGAFFPVANGPGLLADLSLITPHAWFLRGLGTLHGGGGPGDLGDALTGMLLFPGVVLALALAAGAVARVRGRA